jgi:hypothetical protein
LRQYLHGDQIRLTDPHRHPRHPRGMDLYKMTLDEVQALLRLLAEWKWEDMALLVLERIEAERDALLH